MWPTPPDWPLHDLRVGDAVVLEDGERGRVIGFYRTDPETVLILLESGEERTVPVTEPELILPEPGGAT